MADQTWLLVVGSLALAALIPVVWAIVDVIRRPEWQFSSGRKVMWTLTLAIGWLVLWPLALASALLYLLVLRRRFPPATTQPPNPMHQHFGASQGPGSYGPFGAGHYGAPRPHGPGPHPGQQGPGGPYGRSGEQPAAGSGHDPYGYYPPPASLPPAAWYPDPAGSPQERWWDGRGWTHHLRPAPSSRS